MTMLYDEKDRPSDSPLVETVMYGRTASDGTTIRPAECQWHMCVVRHEGQTQFFVTGPLTTSGIATFFKDAEIVWIRFRLGTFMPHLPHQAVRDSETILPEAGGAFWLKGSAWQFPTYENVDTFVERLARDGVLARDPLVDELLQDAPAALPERTARHRFVRATGLTRSHVRQVERAKQAAALLRQGMPILDTVHAAGYFDQPHLTRALRQWVGYTPAQLLRAYTPACRSIQDAAPALDYHADVLTAG